MLKMLGLGGALVAVIVYNVAFYLTLFIAIGGYYVFNTPNRIRRVKRFTA